MTPCTSAAPAAAPDRPLHPLPGGWRVGVFDSGVGGLSILRDLRQALPQARLFYVADSGHAPYGERDVAHILHRSQVLAQFLRDQGAQVLVLACNTATAAAVADLRQRHPGWPIIGVEPGLKPAAAATRNGRISIMATTATLASDKFRQLLGAHSERNGTPLHIHLQPCPGLAHAIEQGDLDAPEVIELVSRYCEPIRTHGSDTVVLGCTHYPFVRHHIESALGPGVTIIDTAEAIARRTVSMCAEIHASEPQCVASSEVRARLWTTGDTSTLQRFADRWLAFAPRVERLDSPAT